MRCGTLLSLLLLTTAAQARPREEKVADNPMHPRPISAGSYVLMDVDTGRVLEGKLEHKRMFPASTTKTMTALVAIESGELDRIYRIGSNPPKTGEQSAYLMEGEQLSLRDLVRAAMIKSANDSCVAIAEAVAGSVPEFADMMNRKAKSVGAFDTHFVNPHGLHNPKHYTTAYDLALIARAAMKNEFFNKTVKTREYSIPGSPKMGGKRLLHNKNRLLFRWAECDGVKTGYTKQAGRCLIASATRINPVTKKPWRLVSVVMHSSDSWSDSANLLLHKGFSAYRPVTVAKADEVMATVPVSGGAGNAIAVTERGVQIPLRGDERNSLKHKVQFWAPRAPVAKGQRLGFLTYTAEGRKVAKIELVAQNAVEPSLVGRIIPGAGSIMPSNPVQRYLIYGVAGLGILLLIAGMQVRANERLRSRKRRAVATNQINYRPPAGYRPPRR